jgi:hypothetical protein
MELRPRAKQGNMSRQPALVFIWSLLWYGGGATSMDVT